MKRGDLSLAHANTADEDFDVHMSTSGADLACQSCHITTDHRVAGKGSDLRPTDNPTPVECTNCHANMGLDAATAFEWVETDTFQLLNHEVGDEDAALRCGDCHGTTTRMDLQGELGYELWGSEQAVCTQSHGLEGSEGFEWVHDKHVLDRGYDCSWCHGFSRPERGLSMPPQEEGPDAIFADGFESGDTGDWGM